MRLELITLELTAPCSAIELPGIRIRHLTGTEEVFNGHIAAKCFLELSHDCVLHHLLVERVFVSHTSASHVPGPSARSSFLVLWVDYLDDCIRETVDQTVKVLSVFPREVNDKTVVIRHTHPIDGKEHVCKFVYRTTPFGENCGSTGIRTPNLLLARESLCQLELWTQDASVAAITTKDDRYRRARAMTGTRKVPVLSRLPLTKSRYPLGFEPRLLAQVGSASMTCRRLDSKKCYKRAPRLSRIQFSRNKRQPASQLFTLFVSLEAYRTPAGVRTLDLGIKSPLLYQLSYRCKIWHSN